MTVKEHYDRHLANFYSWMLGDLDVHASAFESFCRSHRILPQKSGVAFDLGAGNGMQTLALEKLGFKVWAFDFNEKMLDELKSKAISAHTVLDDIRQIEAYAHLNPELAVCCGDTLSHLDSPDDVLDFLAKVYSVLPVQGVLVLSFRDYSVELNDTDRFIPIKSDDEKILTCFLEYFPDKVRVTDLLYEKEGGNWTKRVSSYEKIRLDKQLVTRFLSRSGFSIAASQFEKGVVTIVAKK